MPTTRRVPCFAVRRTAAAFALIASWPSLRAQESVPATGWMRPPEAIARLVEAPPPPSASLSPQHGWLVLVQQEALPGIDVVARPHLKLAGLRIDPDTRGPQLGSRVIGMTLKAMADGKERTVALPAGHWSDPIWSADDRAFALMHTRDTGIELWVADPATEAPKQVPGIVLNAVLGSPVRWLPDQKRLLVQLAVPGDAPARPRAPTGPQVQSSEKGQKAQVRTFQDLLQDAHDEKLFEHYGTSQTAIVDPKSAARTDVGAPAMWDRVECSPDGTLLLATRVERPFSYVVTHGSFPRTTSVLSLDGRERKKLYSSPLREAVPIGGVPTGPRGIDWVATAPHTLCWSEALDGGDPRVEVPQRDQVWLLVEPDGEPRKWFATEHRAAGLSFAADGALVIAGELDRKTRRQRVWRYDARDPSRPGSVLYERSTQDAYGDPGRPINDRRPDGQSVLRQRGEQLFLTGDGASDAGNRPFVDRWSVADGKKQRLFQCAEGRHETFVGFLDGDGARLLVRSESPTDPPSLVAVDTASGARTTVMQFADPAAEFTKGIEKRLVRYEREDGVPLSGTLYLPPGQKPGTKAPVLLWAYPLEYVQASDAGQVRATPNRYLRLSGASHLFLLLHGYAVFDDAAMPIVGPVKTANDTFVEQVQKNARAAIKALAQQPGVDSERVAVAGHSYGAFMTANLLAHTDLFRCGIARSGAYNRTLTPFGFQNEERTFWEAPDVYQAMSPFAHADQIREPLLLIHGQDDNNPGTFPMQSQRLFVAIKGHGGTVRLCMLPNEAHGYRARENVLHCLAETCAWLDAYCKPAAAVTPK
jgi:dipeptidyl aminopeptidase/acylaminoacyl peptidase